VHSLPTHVDFVPSVFTFTASSSKRKLNRSVASHATRVMTRQRQLTSVEEQPALSLPTSVEPLRKSAAMEEKVMPAEGLPPSLAADELHQKKHHPM